jgi:hypothetical protein
MYLGIPLSVGNLKKDLKTFDHSKIRYTPFHVSQLYPNGCDTSFWFDVWYEEDCLADKFPALLSHCKRTDLSVQEVLTQGLAPGLAPRLSSAVGHSQA